VGLANLLESKARYSLEDIALVVRGPNNHMRKGKTVHWKTINLNEDLSSPTAAASSRQICIFFQSN
jgi:hypothetical protein